MGFRADRGGGAVEGNGSSSWLDVLAAAANQTPTWGPHHHHHHHHLYGWKTAANSVTPLPPSGRVEDRLAFITTNQRMSQADVTPPPTHSQSHMQPLERWRRKFNTRVRNSSKHPRERNPPSERLSPPRSAEPRTVHLASIGGFQVKTDIRHYYGLQSVIKHLLMLL